MPFLPLTAAICAIGLLACSTTKESYIETARYSRDYIFIDEIQNSSATNAFDLIETLRPHWLEGRGPKSVRNRMTSYPVVYVDGVRHGNINSLTTIPVYNIVEIQHMSAGDATIRFGMGHPGGAILIAMFN